MINLENFTTALKTIWVRRYAIDKLDDHWGDLLDTQMGIDMEGRDKILEYGPAQFLKIIQKNLQKS